MKKILGISVIAAMAVLPMAANATDLNNIPRETTTADASVLATTKYVKGAFNEAASAINTKQDRLDSTIAASALTEKAETTHLTAGSGVAANLNALDNAILSLEGATSGQGGLGARLTTAENDIDSLETRMGTAETNIGNLQTSTTVGAQETGSHLTQGATVASNLGALNTALITAEGDIDTLETTKQDKSDSTVAATDANDQAITYNYITAGTGVGQNLANLDTAVGKITAAQVSAASHLNASADMATNVAALGAAVKTLETATNGLSTANIATQAGVDNTIDELALTPTGVALSGDVSTTPGSITIAQDWNDANATGTVSFVTGVSQNITSSANITVTQPTISKKTYAQSNS